VRTIKPANFSLTEDCARIFRAVRIAARLDFRFSKETALAVKRLSATILHHDWVSKMLFSIHGHLQPYSLLIYVMDVVHSLLIYFMDAKYQVPM
ncbi:Polynucleotide adenylyltransferase family protein, partial [Perilla frutescens var. hirtella]